MSDTSDKPIIAEADRVDPDANLLRQQFVHSITTEIIKTYFKWIVGILAIVGTIMAFIGYSTYRDIKSAVVELATNKITTSEVVQASVVSQSAENLGLTSADERIRKLQSEIDMLDKQIRSLQEEKSRIASGMYTAMASEFDEIAGMIRQLKMQLVLLNEKLENNMP